MVKVILIEVMLCVKWYGADVLKTWMSAPITSPGKLHWSSSFLLAFYGIEYGKKYELWSRSAQVLSPYLSPYIHWPSASRFQNSKQLSLAPAVNSYLFGNTCSGHSLVQLSGFSIYCTAVRTRNHSGETKTVRGIKAVRDIKSIWLSERRSLCLNCFFNCGWMCLESTFTSCTQKKASLEWVTIESYPINNHPVMSSGLTSLEYIVPTAPISLQFRSAFAK